MKDDDRLLGAGYSRGQAKEQAIEKLRSKASESQQTTLAKLSAGEVKLMDRAFDGAFNWGATITFRGRFLEAWAGELVREGRALDNQLDTLLEGIITLPFHWHSPKSDISEKMGSVLVRRKELRKYEIDVEDFLEAVSEAVVHDANVFPVTQMMNQLQRTLDRAYDLCTFKLTTITTTRATYASIVVAVVAALIALLNAFDVLGASPAG